MIKKCFAVLAAILLVTTQALSQTPVNNSSSIDWKTLYQQIFTWNIGKYAAPGTDLNHLKEMSVYYSPLKPNEIYDQITGVKTSDEAFVLREKLLRYSNNRQHLEGDKSRYLENVSGIKNLVGTAALDVLGLVMNSRHQKVPKSENYFATPLGQTVMEALNDTLMVVIPGFGSHTIPDYTYAEIVEDANEYYGRPKVRTGTQVNGETLYLGESAPERFYSVRNKELKFDIVHPLGNELGNSMGKDVDSANYLKEWIESLPTEYANKKLILVGYSKGTPIAHNVVQLFPSIRKRTIMILTIAGVNQGSVAAQEGVNSLCKATNSQSPEEALEKIRDRGEQSIDIVTSLIASMTGVGITPESTKIFTAILGTTPEGSTVLQRSKETKQYDQALDGIIDLTNFERIKWNLSHLNDTDFDQPLTVMNLSVITNVKDFFLPGRVSAQDVKLLPPLSVPQLNADGKVNFVNYSRDAVFLHLTSIAGFKQSPGGLFDTQVAWLDAKAMPIDHRLLRESLKPGQIDRLALDLYMKNGVPLPADYQILPRNQLLRMYNKARGRTMNNINFIDLGDLRGNHWDVSFRQVYKPSSGPHYEHAFPRKAALTALLETITIYIRSSQKVTEVGVPQ